MLKKIVNRTLMPLLVLLSTVFIPVAAEQPKPEGLPLYYWQQPQFVNFGDYLSLKLVERIVNCPVHVHRRNPNIKVKKLLAIGSLMSFALDEDVIWGTGVNGKLMNKTDYKFTNLDIRAIRGPLSRKFLLDQFGINCPEIYGDPALLVPCLFPEFVKSETPKYDYIVIIHYSELNLFPKTEDGRIIHATDPWDEIISKIVDSKFVISSSLHGVIVAEAFGIPARLLRVSETEPLFKFQDYYAGSGRDRFEYAASIEEALQMGGELPIKCDLQALYNAFPFDYWPNATYTKPNWDIE